MSHGHEPNPARENYRRGRTELGRDEERGCRGRLRSVPSATIQSAFRETGTGTAAMFRYLFEGIAVGCSTILALILAVSVALLVLAALPGPEATPADFPPSLGSAEIVLLIVLFLAIVIAWITGRVLLSRR